MLFKRTLNTKDKEALMKEFEKTRTKYLKDVEALRKKYKKSLINIAVAYNTAV